DIRLLHRKQILRCDHRSREWPCRIAVPLHERFAGDRSENARASNEPALSRYHAVSFALCEVAHGELSCRSGLPETHPLFVRAPTGTDSEFCNTLFKEGNRLFSTFFHSFTGLQSPTGRRTLAIDRPYNKRLTASSKNAARFTQLIPTRWKTVC